jgi:hypothetical protein
LRIFQKIFFDEVSGEVANVVPANSGSNQRELFQVWTFFDIFIAKVRENCIEIVVQCVSKIRSQSTAFVSGQ